MTKKILLLIIFLFISINLFAFTEEQLQLAHNTEFAISQRLQLDTVIARKSSNNRVVLSELALRDLIPTMNSNTKEYFVSFNERIQSLKLIDLKRERLEFVSNAKKKQELLALIPNAISVASIAISTTASVAISSAAGNPDLSKLSLLISVLGTTVSSATNFFSEKSKNNIDNLRSEWDLDDYEMEELNRLGIENYTYKCQIASDYGIPIEMTLSTKDLEAFVEYSNTENPERRMIKLQSLNNRLENLPDYWRMLATTSYELGNYEETLEYISKFEEIYCPIIYHDKDYEKLLMIKCDCINNLNLSDKTQQIYEAAKLIEKNMEIDDWEARLFLIAIFTDLYKQTREIQHLECAYEYYPTLIMHLGSEYLKDVESYIKGKYKKDGIKEIEAEISSAKALVEATSKNFQEIKKAKIDKESQAYQIAEEKKKKAEELKKDLDNKLTNFTITASMMLPPTCDFLCKIMDCYIKVAEVLEKENDTDFINTCSAFMDFITPNYLAFSAFESINYDNVNEPANWVTERVEKRGGFLGMWTENILILESTLSLFNTTPKGAEQIISKDDIRVTLCIGDTDFECTIEDIAFNIGSDMNSSSLSIVMPFKDNYLIQSDKNKKDVLAQGVYFIIESPEEYFYPIMVIIKEGDGNEDSLIYKELLNRLKVVSK